MTRAPRPPRALAALCLLSLLALGPGCASVRDSLRETVTITSMPSGAAVTIDEQPVGRTPVTVDLDKRGAHLVRLEREGYRTAFEHLLPEVSGKAPFVQFGPLREAGAYARLAPNPVHVDLSPTVVPGSLGVDPYAELSYRVMQVDGLLELGRITPEEHAYMIQQLVRFFGQAIPAP